MADSHSARVVLQEIGRAVRRAREAAGLSQSDLGEKTGCTNYAIRRVENGRGDFSLPLLIDVAEALRVPMAQLLGPTPSSQRDADARVLSDRLPRKDLRWLANLSQADLELVVARGREAVAYRRR